MMRVVDNELQDDDGTTFGTFVSHWGACAAMLGQERYVVTCWDERLETVRPLSKLLKNREVASEFADTIKSFDDVRLVAERDIPADCRKDFE